MKNGISCQEFKFISRRSSRNEYDNWLDIAITEGNYTSDGSIQHELGQ